MDYTTARFVVVLCKNHRVHHKGNSGQEHRILVGEPDTYTTLPVRPETIKVRCDNCGEESYKQKLCGG